MGYKTVEARERAGIFGYKGDNAGNIQILLVAARSNPHSWIPPLGGVDAGETHSEAAKRECREESGYQVEIEKEIGQVVLSFSTLPVKFFLGKITAEVTHWEERPRTFVPLADLVQTVPEDFKQVAQGVVRQIG